MASPEINILIKAKTDIDTAVNKVKDSLGIVGKETDKVNDKSQKAGKGIVNAFKSTIAPVNNFFRTIARVGFVFGATFGAMAGLVLNVGKEIDNLDIASARLGISTEKLSQKMYGFNIATKETRNGVNQLKGLINDAKVGFILIGSAISESASKMSAWATSLYTGVSYKEILAGMKDVKKTYDSETLEAESDLQNNINKIRMSGYDYSKQQMNEYIAFLKTKGADELMISEYITLRKQQMQEEKFGVQSFNKSMEDNLRNSVGAMKTTMTGFFNDVFNGQLKKGKDYFNDFTKGILNSFSQMISEMIARWMIFKIMGIGTNPFISVGVSSILGDTGVKHQGGMIRKAHSGTLARDEVPIIAQSGEGILSRKAMRNLGEQGLNDLNSGNGGGGGGARQPVVIIKAWDASDIVRNRKTIEGIIQNAMATNSGVRQTMMKYS